MSQTAPTLVFMSGPQKDRRVDIDGNSAMAGRSPQADITLDEQHASREQVQFELTADGWSVRNLSSYGTRINGKKYKKPKKRILLETGDVFEIGSETKILFVAAGDDVEQAVADYLAEHAPPPEEKEQEQQELPEEEKPKPPPRKSAPEPAEQDEQEESPEMLTEEEKQQKAEKKKKLKRYLIIFGVYMGVIIFVIALLSRLRGGSAVQTKAPPALDDNKIRSILREPIPNKHRNPVKAERAVNKARMLYEDRNIEQEPGNLYRSVKYFKLYLAYTNRSDFERIADERIYAKAETELINRVINQYHKAYVLEQNEQWEDAHTAFEKLLEMIPATSEPEPEKNNPLWDNVVDHLNYVKGKLPKKKKFI